MIRAFKKRERRKEGEGNGTCISRCCSQWQGSAESEWRSTVISPALAPPAFCGDGSPLLPPAAAAREQLRSEAATVSMLAVVIEKEGEREE